MTDFVVQERTLGQILDEAAARFPDREALVYADRDYRQTWREFSDTVDDLAKGLMALGVEPGEKVAIWATNVPHWVTLMFATARIGAVLLTVNTSYRDSELRYLLRQSECENLFIIDGYRDHDYIATVYSVAPELKTQPRGSLRCADLPHLKRVMFLGMEKHRGMYSLAEIMDMQAMIDDEEYAARKARVGCHDVVNMQYTSGTTGFPKGVMLTHAGIGNNGFWIGENQKLTERDRVCLPVPLFHCFGCVLGVMACVTHASTMVILEHFSPVHVMAAIDQEKCTAAYGVPTMYLAVVEHKLFKRFDYSSLRTGIMSGAVCPEPLMRRVLEEMNMREITIPYGLTEASPVMTMTTTDETLEHRCQTVGRAMPGIESVVLANPHSPSKAVKKLPAMREKVTALLAGSGAERSFEFTATDSLEAAVREADIILTATPAREPMIKADWVQPGTHLSCIGADISGKQEIDSAVFATARAFGDDRAQCFAVGECEIPHRDGILTELTEIGAVMLGKALGRLTSGDVTVFDSTGIALQDLASAAVILERAEAIGVGTVVTL